RLSDENNLLQPYRDKYHAVDKQLAKLEEKLQTKRSVEIVSGSCIAIGGALIGFALSSQSSPSSLPFGICGGVLLLGGIVAKAIKL
ncbi:MAG: hypothetical protein JO266_04255, partial [Acidobacteria bacterium]|nr:hypothetical protein [Acidobacteriota bacterium]